MKIIRRPGFMVILIMALLASLPGLRPVTPARAAGTVSLTGLGTSYTQDFNTLANTGTTNTIVPTGWDFYDTGTNANTTYRGGTGSDNAGDTYSFGVTNSSERAFGMLFSNSLASTIGASFTNDTGGTITSIAISYTGEQWRLGYSGRGADRIDFQYSTSATSLSTGTWSDVDGLDFSSPTTTGTAGALSSPSTASVSYTITGLSIANGAAFWIRWTDYNVTNADDGLAVDDFSITPQGGAAQPNLTIDDVSQNEGNSGTSNFSFTVSLSAPAGAGGVTFDIATANGTATAGSDYVAKSLTGQTIPAGSSSYTFDVVVNGDTDGESNETFLVNVTNVTGATMSDGQGLGTIITDDIAITPIHDVQGSGSTAATGTFTIEGIVVGDYQTTGTGQLSGFFVQEEDADIDASAAPSEGIFIYCGGCSTAVNVGDKVRVTGASSEYNGLSELSATTAGSVVVLSTNNSLPTPGSIDLPVPGVPSGNLANATTAINAYYEQLEGMLVKFPDTG